MTKSVVKTPRITEPCKRSLLALTEFWYLRPEQINAYLGRSSLRLARENLATLKAAELVVSEPFHRRARSGRSAELYTYTPKAVTLLAQEDLTVLPADPAPFGRLDSFYQHLEELNWVIIDTLRLGREREDITIPRWYHDRWLRRRLREKPFGVTVDGKTSSTVPDAWFETHTDLGEVCPVWLELDRGTEDKPEEWRLKVKRIVAFFQSDAYPKLFETEALTRIIVVCAPNPARYPDPRVRIAALRRWTDEALGEDADVFTFTTTQEYGATLAKWLNAL